MFVRKHKLLSTVLEMQVLTVDNYLAVRTCLVFGGHGLLAGVWVLGLGAHLGCEAH